MEDCFFWIFTGSTGLNNAGSQQNFRPKFYYHKMLKYFKNYSKNTTKKLCHLVIYAIW